MLIDLICELCFFKILRIGVFLKFSVVKLGVGKKLNFVVGKLELM